MERREILKGLLGLGALPLFSSEALARRRIPIIRRVRCSSTAERTRIVLDISGKVSKSSIKSEIKGKNLIITVSGARSNRHYRKLKSQLAYYVKVIPMSRTTTKVRVKLKAPHKYKIFALKARCGKPFRIVIDILPDFLITKCELKKATERVVVIDPGHGGKDPGAVYPLRSRHPYIMEKHITLSIARKVKRILSKEKGIKVIMTRERDIYVPLLKRAEIAAKSCADAFVSIHADSMPNYPQWSGVTVFKASPRLFAKARTTAEAIARRVKLCSDVMCWSVSPLLINMSSTVTFAESRRLARFIVKNLKAHSNEDIVNGIRDMRRNILVLKTPGRPAVLVESGFMTNREDRHRLLKSWYQEEVAAGIARGIKEYINFINNGSLV